MYKKHVHKLPKMYLNKVRTFQNYEQNIIYFGHTPPFTLQKNSLKNAKFSELLHLIEVLVATFTKPADLDIIIPNLSDKLNLFWSHTSVFA